MKAEDKLKKLFSLLMAAAKKDSSLATEIDRLFGVAADTPDSSIHHSKLRNRRKPAAFDPFEIYEQGEAALRLRLGDLDIEELKDMVAAHGMDPGKLVLKWKTKERILEHILSTVQTRSRKGDAFRS